MLKNKLKGKRIAILSADGYEKSELILPLKAMQFAGAKVDIVSIRRGKIRGMNLHRPAGKIRVQKLLYDIVPEDYDGLFIPGGFINPDLLRQSLEVRDFVTNFFQSGRPVASLCHGPWVLASAELLKGRTLTSWPGIRDDLVHAGAIWINEPVVRDGNLVTSRGPQDLRPFIQEMISLYAGEDSEECVVKVSSSQVNEPPFLEMKTKGYFPLSLKALVKALRT